MSILCYSLFSVVFLGLPGLRFCGTGTVVCSATAGVSTIFFGLPGLRFGCSVFTFFGLPGLRLGFTSAGFSFFGLPGLLFGVIGSVEIVIEFVAESGVGVVKVEFIVVKVIPLSFNFLGLPGLRFVWIGCCSAVSGCDSGSDAIFRLPLFTSVKSGLTW